MGSIHPTSPDVKDKQLAGRYAREDTCDSSRFRMSLILGPPIRLNGLCCCPAGLDRGNILKPHAKYYKLYGPLAVH